MADFPFDVVAFDLDGTLADTAPDLAAALNRTLAGIGRPAIDLALVRTLIGQGGRALLRKTLAATGAADDALVKELLPRFIEYYAADICTGTACYSALEPAMAALAARGVALAICTNKNEPLTRKLVAALGWDGRFASIVGADTLAVHKPDPAPLLAAIAGAGGGRGVFVGDSITDANTARAAGVPFVAVSFGFSDRPASQLGAAAVIDDYAELIGVLEKL